MNDSVILLRVIVTALVFGLTDRFHDTANAIGWNLRTWPTDLSA